MTESPIASYRTVASILRLDTRWPDPEPCCGRFYCKLKERDNCWEATGEVQSIYLDHLIDPINDVTSDVLENLGRNLSYRPIFSHNIYMVGQEKRKSNPIIFFCCEDESARTKARNIVTSSCEILKKYPGIRLGDMSFAPECNATPDIPTRITDSDPSIQQDSSPLRVFIKPDVLSPGERIPGIGVPIVFDLDEQNKYRHATIGGFITLGSGTIYGLTTAHGFQKSDYKVVKSKTPQVRKFDYSLDPSDLSDSKTLQDPAENDDASIERASQLTRSSALASSQTTPRTVQMITTDDTGRSETALDSHDRLLGEVAYSSMENNSLGLDWALIELTYTRLNAVNFVHLTEYHIIELFHRHNRHMDQVRSVTIRGVEPRLPRPLLDARSVLAVTGESGVLTGTIPGASTSILLPGTSRMQEVWHCTLNGAIREGDCGSFVIDLHSANVYGHIVAGVIGTGFAYIVPAYGAA